MSFQLTKEPLRNLQIFFFFQLCVCLITRQCSLDCQIVGSSKGSMQNPTTESHPIRKSSNQSPNGKMQIFNYPKNPWGTIEELQLVSKSAHSSLVYLHFQIKRHSKVFFGCCFFCVEPFKGSMQNPKAQNFPFRKGSIVSTFSQQQTFSYPKKKKNTEEHLGKRHFERFSGLQLRGTFKGSRQNLTIIQTI